MTESFSKLAKKNEKNMDTPLFRRLNILFFVVFLLFAILIFKLANVQLVKGDEYVQKLIKNNTTTLSLTAPRGWIYDSNGEILVTNRPTFVVTFTESVNQDVDHERVARDLAEIIGMKEVDILYAMDYQAPRRSSRYLPRQIKMDVDDKVVAYISEHKEELPGINVSVEPVRVYLYDDLAAHAIGYISPIPENQREKYQEQGYRIDEKIGIDGLEKEYESYLRGIAGYKTVEVNRYSQPIKDIKTVDPVRGADMTLTIDKTFQERVQDIVEKQVLDIQTREYKPITDVKEAVVVAMNPQTGAILASVSYPSYDPNTFTRPLTQADVDYLFTDSGNLPLLNRAVDAAYEVGSVVKMATVTMGLQEGVILPNTQIYDTGSIMIGSWTTPFRSWLWSGHGWNNPQQAITVSNNVYMYHIAMWIAKYPNAKNMNWSMVRNAPQSLLSRLNPDWKREQDLQPAIDTFKKYFAMYGIGVPTGVDLPKDSPGWPMNVTEIGELAYVAIGQNQTLTAMQLAQYVSAIANDGERLAPFFVERIVDNSGKTILHHEKNVLNKVDVDLEYLRIVQNGMHQITRPGGSVHHIFADLPVTVAGKTGTAETGTEGHTNATFVAYAPFENPEIALAVIIPKGGGGSDASAQLTKDILAAYFQTKDDTAVEEEDESQEEALD